MYVTFCRFLASAAELEDNTTFTDAYGTEHFVPAVHGGVNVVSDEEMRAHGSDFIARYVFLLCYAYLTQLAAICLAVLQYFCLLM